MKVVVHIGSPKTGSSAIQYFLSDNRDLLARHGFYYPEHSYDENLVSGGHQKLASFLRDGDIKSAKTLADSWIKAAARNNHILLISGEGFYTQGKELLAAFKSCKLSVIGYVRDPVEFLISNHNQSVKRHYNTESLQEFLERNLKGANRGVNGDYFFVWREAVGSSRLNLRPYFSSAFFGGRIELDFLKALGVDEQNFGLFKLPGHRINNAYSPEALELKRLLNLVMTEREAGLSNRIDIFLQRHSDTSSQLEANKSRAVPASQHLIDRLYEYFKPTNKAILTELVNDPPAGFLDGSRSFESGPTVDLAAVTTLYRQLAKALPDVVRGLESKVISKLIESGLSYNWYKLAEVMRVPFKEPRFSSGIDQALLNVCAQGGAGAPAYLRELSAMLLERGFAPEALNVISEAERLRPGGQQIIKIRQKAEQCVKEVNNA